MFNIHCLNPISNVGLENLTANYELTEDVNKADGILVRSASMHEMELPEQLLAVARAGAGTNNIPIDKCSEKGIVVFNTPGANANAVKELVLAGLFLASRDVVGGINWASTLTGDDVAKQVEKGKSNFAGREIIGKTLGVIGLGAIGALVSNAAIDLGMNVVGYDPFLSVNSALRLSSAVKVVSDLDELFKKCDYITIHIPYIPAENKGFINSGKIRKMKDGVVIINCARGELVDSDAILAALESGKAAAYVTDFPTDAQLCVDGVTAIPHLGASTPESEENCAAMAAQELADYLEKGVIKNSVNLPNAALPESFENRTCFIHKEDEAFGTKVTAEAIAQGAAVKNLFSASKKGMGYTVIDTDKPLDTANIEGTIRIRTI